MNTCIVAAGVKQDIGCRVILWDEPGGYSFYKSGKLVKRKYTYEQLQYVIKLFCLHHAQNYRASHVYAGLNSRGLSVNFIIDDDCDENGFASVYQAADIRDYCYSHKPINHLGPGVELSSMVNHWAEKNLYSEENQKKYNVGPRKIMTCNFHGISKTVYAMTDAQVNSLVCLLAGFGKLFPTISMDFPRDEKGIITTVTKKIEGYIINHFNINSEKIDALGLNYEDIVLRVAEKMSILPPPQAEISLLKKLMDKARSIFQ